MCISDGNQQMTLTVYTMYAIFQFVAIPVWGWKIERKVIFVTTSGRNRTLVINHNILQNYNCVSFQYFTQAGQPG
jgi:hypothetical protein